MVPAGIPGPVTYMPTARLPVFATFTAAEALVSAELVFLKLASEMRKLAAVVGLLIVKVVGLVMAVIVDPPGMPGPLTVCPNTRPDVLPTVITLDCGVPSV